MPGTVGDVVVSARTDAPDELRRAVAVRFELLEYGFEVGREAVRGSRRHRRHRLSPARHDPAPAPFPPGVSVVGPFSSYPLPRPRPYPAPSTWAGRLQQYFLGRPLPATSFSHLTFSSQLVTAYCLARLLFRPPAASTARLRPSAGLPPFVVRPTPRRCRRVPFFGAKNLFELVGAL